MNVKEIQTIVLGIERHAFARELEPGDSIGILLPEGTDVKRGDYLTKSREAIEAYELSKPDESTDNGN